MKKIKYLTPEQKAKFPQYVKEWTDIGRCTMPADRPSAEKAIRQIYQVAGLKPPLKIVWCDSPLSSALTRIVVQEYFKKFEKGNAKNTVKNNALDSVGNSVWNSVWDSVRNSVWDSVWDNIRDSVGNSVVNNIWNRVRDSVWDNVGDSIRYSVYGQHDADWLGFFRYFRDECGLVQETEKLEGLWNLCKSAGWAIPHQNICWVSERHNILHWDEQNRLHCIDGPALGYPDGFAIYAWHGVRVPERIIMHPETITPDEIAKEQNAEIRRVMLEQFGRDKFLQLPTCQKVHSDDYGILYRNNSILDVNGEPYCFVKVVNSTPNPDGTYKDYILRVNPHCQTAREAVQSTFPRIKDFAPAIES